MTTPLVERDERTTAIENAGYRWSYLVLSFGLLALVAFRSLTRGEQSWDLIALVVIGGVVNVGYQAVGRVVYRRWVVLAVVTALAAAVVAAMMLWFRR